MAYHKKIVNQRNPRRNAGSPQKTCAKITALYNTNPRSVQLVARNRELRTEVEFPRSVQLVARNREYPKGLNNVPCVVRSCIKMHATI